MDRHARNERNLVVREPEPTGAFVLVFGLVLVAANLGWV